MKLKRIATSMLALLLVLSMLLSACSRGGHSDPEPTPGPGNENENLNACAHVSTELRNARAADCTTAGYTGDKVCTACGTVVEAGTAIAVLPHAWDEGVVTKEPDCVDQGWLTITCTGCGTTKGESLPTVEHSDRYHDALDGTHSHTCLTCTMNAYEAHVPVDANGTYYASTCTADGYTEYECSLCGGVYREYSETDKAFGHAWGDWTVLEAANCANEGKKIHVCGNENCGQTEELAIPVAPGVHNHVEDLSARVEASCTAVGSMTLRCEYCGDPVTKEIPMLDHELGEPVQVGSRTDRECLHCDYKVSTFEATEGSATVNTGDIAADRNFEVSFKDDTKPESANTNITFPQEVVSQITGSNAEVKVDAGVADKAEVSTEGLTEEQKQRLDSVDVYNFGLSVGGEPVGSFNAGVTVTIPYELQAVEWDEDGNPIAFEDPEGIQIWYVPTDGSEIEIIGDEEGEKVVYNAENGTVTFVVQHFSFYAVAYAETQEMKCRRGRHDMEQIGEPVPATCWSYGYTVIECVCCHVTELKDVQEKHDHNYSDPINPNVTCTQGGYVYRECLNDGCGDVVLMNYIRATGHTVTGKATCTEASICSTCHQIVTPAYGHNWTEWITVVEPTDVKAGLRRRHCPRCGTIEESKLAATGLVDPIKYESWNELYQGVMKDMLGTEKAMFKWSMTDPEGAVMDYVLTMEVKGNDVLALTEVTRTSSSGESRKMTSLYRNGVIVSSNTYDDETYFDRSDDELDLRMPVSLMLEYCREILDYYAPTVEGSFAQIAEMLTELDGAFGEELNAALKEAGYEGTAISLAETFDAMQKVYAYAALKLGYTPGIDLGDGIELPAGADFTKVLEALTTKTADGTNTVYTWNPEELLAALDAVLTTLEAQQEKTLAQVVYECIGPDLAATYPEIVDFDTMMAKLAAELPGTMLVKDLVNKIVNIVEADGTLTMAEVYAAIDALVLQAYGEEIDSEAMIAEYGELSLNDMLAGMMGEGATMEALYEQLSASLKQQLFGEFFITEEVSVGQILMMARQYLTMADLKCDIAIVLDQNGNFVSFVADEKLDFVMPGETEADEERMTLECFYLEFKCDDSVTVVIPDGMQSMLDLKAEITFDAQGNLVVKAPDGYEYDFYLEGSKEYPIKDLLTLDSAMTAALGCNVYVLNPNVAEPNEVLVGQYIEIDGKYYRYGTSWNYDRVYGDSVAMKDLLENPETLLPAAGEPADGYMEWNGERLDVWQTPLAPIYQQDGVWYIATDYGDWDYDDGHRFNVWSTVSFETAAANLKLSSISYSSEFEMEKDGVTYRAWDAYMSVDGNRTVRVMLYADANSNLYLVEYDEIEQGTYFYLYEEIDELPTCDSAINEEEGTGEIRLLNGQLAQKSYKTWSCTVNVPDYYVKVSGELYAPLYEPYSWDEGHMRYTEGFKSYVASHTMTPVELPDGNTLYAIDYSYEVSAPFEMVHYGYVQVAQDLWLQTLAYYAEGEIAEVLYRNAVGTYHARFSEVFDLDEYVTANGNTFTVSATLLSELKALCTEPGEYYVLTLESDGGLLEALVSSTTLSFTVSSLFVPEDIDPATIFGGKHATANKGESWYQYFGYGGSDTVEVVNNGDGTLTLVLRSGTKATISYEIDGGFLADDYLTHDGKNEQGLDVYSMINSYYYNTYIRHNNAYYHYSGSYEFALLSFDYATSLRDQIANRWYIRNLSYRYDFTDDQGNVYPVYDGRVAFDYDSWYGSVDTYSFFFMIKDGQLMVLAGAQELGYMSLKFEAMIPASVYFANAGATAQKTGEAGSQSYWNNGRAKVNIAQISFSEVDAAGNVWGEKTIQLRYVMQNGATRYLNDCHVTGYYLDLTDAEATVLPAGYTNREEYKNEYVNGTFDFIELSWPDMTYYVKLAGLTYRLNNTWESYENRAVSYEQFLENMADSSVYFRVWDNTLGTYTYWLGHSFSGNDVYLYDQIVGGNIIFPENASVTTIGYTSDGRAVEEIYGYRLESLCSIEQDDGTVFYHVEGETDGYLKGQDGRYVRAALLQDQNGKEYVLCYELERATVRGDKVSELGVLDDYVTYNEQAGTITVKQELLEMLAEEENSYSFQMILRVEGYGDYWYSYAELEGYFMQGGQGNEGGNGFTDQDYWEDKNQK